VQATNSTQRSRCRSCSWASGSASAEAEPAIDCEIADPASGRVLAIAEACWPEGLQPGQGSPVVLELDPEEADLPRLKELGYEVFTSADSLPGYVYRRNQEAAGPVAEPPAGVGTTSQPETPSEPERKPGGGPEARAAFEKAMKNVYVLAKTEAGYDARLFLNMLSNLGGLGTAKRLLATTDVSSGFTVLYERGRLDLTVEALVVKPEFASLFTDDEIEIARQRLTQLGYKGAGA
jgi:hypothetical protein